MNSNRRIPGPRMASGVTRRRACGFRRCAECGRVIGPLALVYRVMVPAWFSAGYEAEDRCPACAFWAGLVEG